MIYYSLIAVYGYLGRIEEAEAAFARLTEIAPHVSTIATMVGDSGQNENIVWDALIPGLRKAGVPET
jgi:pentatricopeptide repeat protein